MMDCARTILTWKWTEEIRWLTVQSRMCVLKHTWTDDGITYDNTVYGYLPWQWETHIKNYVQSSADKRIQEKNGCTEMDNEIN